MAASPQSLVREALRSRVRDLFGVELQTVTLEFPPSLDLGDLACPVAFELARVVAARARPTDQTRLFLSAAKWWTAAARSV